MMSTPYFGVLNKIFYFQFLSEIEASVLLLSDVCSLRCSGCRGLSYERFTENIITVIFRIHGIPDSWRSLICLKPKKDKEKFILEDDLPFKDKVITIIEM